MDPRPSPSPVASLLPGDRVAWQHACRTPHGRPNGTHLGYSGFVQRVSADGYYAIVLPQGKGPRRLIRTARLEKW